MWLLLFLLSPSLGCVVLTENHPGFPTPYDQAFCLPNETLPSWHHYQELLATFPDNSRLYSVYVGQNVPRSDVITVGLLTSDKSFPSLYRDDDRMIVLGTCGGGMKRFTETKTWYHWVGGPPGAPGEMGVP